MSNVKRDQMIERASFAGKRAAEQGKTVRDNPFMENTLYWLCWKDGFVEQQESEIDKEIGGQNESL